MGVEKGEFPKKYLGVTLKPSKWNNHDCACVIVKIRRIVNCWSTRHLSFAGQAQLVSLVLFRICACWVSIFCLPQSVVKEIVKLCRNFLWG